MPEKKSPKKNNRSLIITIVAAGIVIAAVILFIGQKDSQSGKQPDNQNANPSGKNTRNDAKPPTPSTTPLAVEISLPKNNYRHGEAISFTSKIRNTTDAPRQYEFTSTCTQGQLYVDGQRLQAAQLCGAAMTDIVIQPAEQLTYKYDFKLVQAFSQPVENTPIEYEGELLLKLGKHSAYLEWQDAKSQTIDFTITH